MSTSNPDSGNAFCTPEVLSAIMDAVDDLSLGIDLVELIAMACRQNPSSDEKAISAGAHSAIERFIGAKNSLLSVLLLAKEARLSE